MRRRPNAVRLAVAFAFLLPAIGVAGPSLVGHAQNQEDWQTTCSEIQAGPGVLGDVITCLDSVINQIGSVGPNALAAIVSTFSAVISDLARDIQDFGRRIHVKELIQAGEIIEKFGTLTSGLAEAFNEIISLPAQIANDLVEAGNQMVGNIKGQLDRIVGLFEDLGGRIGGLFEPITDWLGDAQNTIQEAFGI